jgi:hypothetical protein
LAGYTRQPELVLLVQEYDWLATNDERVLGILTWDRIDHDFGWIALGRDERLRYRAVDVNASLATSEAARADLIEAMRRLQAQEDHEFYQGDVIGEPIDFFAPVVPPDRLNPFFRILQEQPRYSPARELVAAMMRYFEDEDGNFIEQFQTAAFDARIWELYLYAVFTELGCAREPDIQAPDFVLQGVRGRFVVEATTANPAQRNAPAAPANEEEFRNYLENYVPIKIGRALKNKLNRGNPYWEMPHVAGLPFVLAVQDFHAGGSMRTIVPAATEYVFGVRHTLVEGRCRIDWIDQHSFNAQREASGFFRLPNSEHVSAVIVNPQGTLAKFNRLGFIAGFGDRRVRMVRYGYRRNDHNLADPRPRPFRDEVHALGYRESWVDGMVVLHNPRALIPLDPELIPGATHEFLRPNGEIMSLMPECPPYIAQTIIWIDGESNAIGEAQ